MFRLLFVVFFGPAKTEDAEHAHESPPVMTWPLIVLAVFSVIGGFIGIDCVRRKTFTHGEAHHGGWIESLLQPFGHNLLAAMFGILAALAGISLAGDMLLERDHRTRSPCISAGSRARCATAFTSTNSTPCSSL